MAGSAQIVLAGALASAMVMTISGCVSKSSADARVQAAYFAGQRAAFVATGADPHTSVGVVGPVKHSRVPWVDGLTLVQAIATAEYVGRHNPQEIIITRHGQLINVDPAAVLNGHPVSLQPGDTVELREDKTTPRTEPKSPPLPAAPGK